MKLCAAVVVATVLACSLVQAQTLTTPNLINPAGTAWGIPSNQVMGIGGISAVEGVGPTTGSAYYNSETNTIRFGYSNSTVAQTIAINQALSGTGIQVSGFSWNYQWMNGGYSSGTLQSSINMTSGTGAILQSRNFVHGVQSTADWQTESGTHTFNAYPLSSLGNLSMSFTGQDDRFWNGLYGPRVRNANLGLVYTVDPCVSNPLYSPSCSGYNNVLTSQNILAQSYAINTALNLSGSGVYINGFKYGYDVYVGGQWCSVYSALAPDNCGSWDPSAMAVGVWVTDKNATVLYENMHTHNTQNTLSSHSYSHVFTDRKLLSNMGNFTMSTGQYGTGAVFNAWSNWQYTPDPCVANPLYSTTCEGYQQAYFNQQCSANAFYNSACPGYAQAYFAQQCTISALYNPSCPGYASAYLTYQCSISPLYSTTCPGYAEAYLNDQCIKDSLYSPQCAGYATAYAIKYLTPISSGSTTASAVNSPLSSTAATDPAVTKTTQGATTTTVSTDGTVSTGVSATGDTNVDKAIAPKTTATTGAQPAAPVQLTPASSAPTQQMSQNDARAESRRDEPRAEKKESATAERPAQQAQQNTPGGEKPQPTARQELQEKRQAQAKAEAIEKGKNLAGEMGRVADLESQKQIQNVVIQAMAFTPGFDAYGKATIPDGAGYRPFTVYNNQRNIENRVTSRMFGGTDRLHSDMVDQQYQQRK